MLVYIHIDIYKPNKSYMFRRIYEKGNRNFKRENFTLERGE